MLIDTSGRKWKLKVPEEALQNALSKSLKISALLSRILINRGIVDIEEAGRFLSSGLSDLRSPLNMKGMQIAVERIILAIRKQERITIYGDYDVDGITSTSLLFLFLNEAGANVSYFIPDRMTNGYGLTRQAIKHLHDNGTKLLVTVDCGISNIDEVAYASDLGMDVIITDHHEVPDTLPSAVAIINPKQPGCPFPFKYLAGVGVAFNLAIALRAGLRDQGFWTDGGPNLREYLDLVALGTIADIAPLLGENRIFVKYGLMELTETKRPGIIALKEVCRLKDTMIKADMVGYRMAPRINAAGRLGRGSDAVRLLITRDKEEAFAVARMLDEGNRERQEVEELIYRDAIERVETMHGLSAKKSIVLASDNWHPGVIGIVASRLVDRYYRPTILISIKDEIGKGSGRSIHSFMLYEGLKECSHLLTGFGGHDYAAGLSLKVENIDRLSEEFEKIASMKLSDDDMIPEIEIDAHIELKDITEPLISEIDILAPFGKANPEPVFSSAGLDILDQRVVGNKHLRLKFIQNGKTMNAIWFGEGDRSDLDSSASVKITYIPQINLWNGQKSIQLKLRDAKVE